MQTSESLDKSGGKKLNDYMELVETVARVEYTRLKNSMHLVEYSELVNIGAMAIHVLISTHKNTVFNISYLSTAIKWAIRNELRRRYKWFSCKHLGKKPTESSDELEESDSTRIREAIYETILSIEDLADAENPTQIKDMALNPEENFEFGELSKAIKNAMKSLPPREKQVLEIRFYKGKKIREIASELQISSSRVSRIIQTGLNRIKENLKRQELV